MADLAGEECTKMETSTKVVSGSQDKQTAALPDTPVIDGPRRDMKDEAILLQGLNAEVHDQDELERNIARQADQLLTEQANERDQKRLEKTASEKSKLESQIRKLETRLNQPTSSTTTTRLRAEIANYQVQIESLDEDAQQIQERIDERHQETDDHRDDQVIGNRRMPNESQRDFLIRTGKITPFSKMPGQVARTTSNLGDVLLDAEEDRPEEDPDAPEDAFSVGELRSHRNLLQPGFADHSLSETTYTSPITSESERNSKRPIKRRRLQDESAVSAERSPQESSGTEHPRDRQSRSPNFVSSDDASDDSFTPEVDHSEAADPEMLSQGEDDSDSFVLDTAPPKPRKRVTKANSQFGESVKDNLAGLDDGNERIFESRVQSWVKRRSAARRRAKSQIILDDESSEGRALEEPALSLRISEEVDDEEWYMPHPTIADTEYDGGYKIPGDIYPALFDYQKTGTQWLWELYSQKVGGIIGDEMGLGKTIQTIAFLAGLHHSKMIQRPIIVVCPATVMKQWVNEFHTWWPPFRVSILHSSGSGMIDIGRESRREDDLSAQVYGASRHKPVNKARKSAQEIVNRVVQNGHVLVTTYSGLQTYAELLIPVDWEYAVLDEGHKIRNPNTAITIYCKELRTANRVILSGTPMQNNLIELWSLFDFVFPMRLGTLVNFRYQFEFPIKQGGYANASNLQVQTASRCAETLKDTISPYLLQRFKVDVATDLPKKTEQVLFCKLTRPQREAYENFLASDDMKSILNGRRQVLYGIDILRKICNHPDLQDHRTLSIKSGYNYGSGVRSGKMVVVRELLDVWRNAGHKTLLFAQHRIMLDILEKYVKSIDGLHYRRMDGNTPISKRQAMVDEFNNNPEAHVFLLTTKVGGLGINLTGADRVIIYDPDWNPSTDIQARERAWRLGQKREVQIYRLMVAGTIEEKIFHRQVFKQFLTNKILRDPKQRQTFQLKDLHDLFTLGGADEGSTETGRLFQGTEVRFERDKPSAAAKDLAASDGVIPPQQAEDGHSVRDMAGVASIQPVQGEEDEKKSGAPSADASNSEARIMEGIFARSGVHSALEHDQIINGKRVIAADPKMIEREARKVAEEAASELKKAEAIARAIPVGTPTWTGEFGIAGRPDQQPGNRSSSRASGRGGPASSSILAGLQNRQAAHAMSNDSRSSTPLGGIGGGPHAPKGATGKVDFLKLIRDYLFTHGGKVHTQMLIDHFNRHCGTAEKTAEFKEMLKTIAVLQKGSRGRGVWILKDEYKAGR